MDQVEGALEADGFMDHPRVGIEVRPQQVDEGLHLPLAERGDEIGVHGGAAKPVDTGRQGTADEVVGAHRFQGADHQQRDDKWSVHQYPSRSGSQPKTWRAIARPCITAQRRLRISSGPASG